MGVDEVVPPFLEAPPNLTSRPEVPLQAGPPDEVHLHFHALGPDRSHLVTHECLVDVEIELATRGSRIPRADHQNTQRT